MKTSKILFVAIGFLFVTPYGFSARSALTGTNNSSTTPTAPIVDVVNRALMLYDKNHDGRLGADELKRMAVLEPTLFAQASAFADKNGNLGVDELSAWRTFIKATAKPATGGG